MKKKKIYEFGQAPPKSVAVMLQHHNLFEGLDVALCHISYAFGTVLLTVGVHCR